jgi:hypothetical protein
MIKANTLMPGDMISYRGSNYIKRRIVRVGETYVQVKQGNNILRVEEENITSVVRGN